MTTARARPAPTTVLFDLDGTLVHTTPAVIESCATPSPPCSARDTRPRQPRSPKHSASGSSKRCHREAGHRPTSWSPHSGAATSAHPSTSPTAPSLFAAESAPAVHRRPGPTRRGRSLRASILTSADAPAFGRPFEANPAVPLRGRVVRGRVVPACLADRGRFGLGCHVISLTPPTPLTGRRERRTPGTTRRRHAPGPGRSPAYAAAMALAFASHADTTTPTPLRRHHYADTTAPTPLRRHHCAEVPRLTPLTEQAVTLWRPRPPGPIRGAAAVAPEAPSGGRPFRSPRPPRPHGPGCRRPSATAGGSFLARCRSAWAKRQLPVARRVARARRNRSASTCTI
jgi:hypothetical protein